MSKSHKELPVKSIVISHPRIANEWHPTKNHLRLHEVSPGSNKKVWWKCHEGEGHEWEATVNNRTKINGTTCPYCVGRKILPSNSLGSTHPEIAAQWHPIKNIPVTVYEVSYGSKFKAWWKCPQGEDHEWETSINKRTSGQGCPICLNRTVTMSNCLATTHPELAAQWHPIKNELTPYIVSAGCNSKVWWKCNKGIDHEWEATVNNRTKENGTKCAVCSNQKVVSSNCLATTHPELSMQWHPDKNSPMTANEVTFGSKFKAWWICRWGHEWQAQVGTRSKGHGCPKCNFRSSKLEVRIFSELQYLFPDTLWQDKSSGRELDIYIPSFKLAFEIDGWYWHNTEERLNSDLKKHTLMKELGITLVRIYDDRIQDAISDVLINYKNGENDLNVIHRLLRRLIECGCILHQDDISRINKYLSISSYCGDVRFAEIIAAMPGPLLKDSLLLHPLANEWHPTKNSIKPEQLSCGSKTKGWWLCEKGHEWEAQVGSRVAGRGCPYCAGKLATPTNNLAVVCPELTNEWHQTMNEELSPNEVLPSSNKKVWWKCNKNHEWRATIDNRRNGSGCPFCWGRIAHNDYNLALTNPELLADWHPIKNGDLTAYDVTPRSAIKVWWQCDKKHEWQAAPEHRTRGHGCHYCSGQKVTIDSCLASTHPELLKEWDFEKNIISPNEISYGSAKKVWWKCNNDHTWDAVVKNRTKREGTGCPKCLGRIKKLTDFEQNIFNS